VLDGINIILWRNDFVQSILTEVHVDEKSKQISSGTGRRGKYTRKYCSTVVRGMEMPFDEKNVDQTYMHVSPLNYCPAAFAALLLYKERLQYVNERNLRLY
jgi:hypothetical protein